MKEKNKTPSTWWEAAKSNTYNKYPPITTLEAWDSIKQSKYIGAFDPYINKECHCDRCGESTFFNVEACPECEEAINHWIRALKINV